MFLLVIAPVFFSMQSRSIVSRQVKLDEDALRTWNAAFPVSHLRRLFRGDVHLLKLFGWIPSKFDGALNWMI